jgi:glycosidase
VNLPYDEQLRYFGSNGDELTMQFDFITMQKLYLSLAREDARPLAEAVLSRPRVHPNCQWATFVRNHDELTLDKLTEEERQEVFDAFGPDPEMQIYGRGLIRRLPTMVDGDQRRIRMVYSLLFSLPGTPVLFYGEEIGMGENLQAQGRSAVRIPNAVDVGQERRLLLRCTLASSRTRRDRQLRAGARQRGGPAPRPRLAAGLPHRSDPPLS